MNRHDAAARLELLLARVIARKDTPRGQVFTATAPAAVEAPAKPTTPEVMAAVDALDDDANDGSPEVSLHPPLAGDPGIGPEIDLIERTMDLDVLALESTLAATQETSVSIARPFQPAPVVDVSATFDEAATLDDLSPLSREPEPLRAPTPLPLRAPTPARPVAAVEPEVVEPEALAPHRPVMRASTPPPLRVPTPAPLRAPTPVPVVEAPAPVVEAPAPVVKVEAPVAPVLAPERFESQALPVEAAVVAVVAMAPHTPRSLRELLARSMTLKVRPSPRG